MHFVEGCGNSLLSQSLYEHGFTDITNIDYSEAVITNMKTKFPHMKWLVMDISNITEFTEGIFDVVRLFPIHVNQCNSVLYSYRLVLLLLLLLLPPSLL